MNGAVVDEARRPTGEILSEDFQRVPGEDAVVGESGRLRYRALNDDLPRRNSVGAHRLHDVSHRVGVGRFWRPHYPVCEAVNRRKTAVEGTDLSDDLGTVALSVRFMYAASKNDRERRLDSARPWILAGVARRELDVGIREALQNVPVKIDVLLLQRIE